MMRGPSFWWLTSSPRERFTVLGVAISTVAAVCILTFVKALPSVSCDAANEARAEAEKAMKEAVHAGPEDRCDAYRKMSALLARYRSAGWSCAPFGGRDASATLDVQTRFYERLVSTCDARLAPRREPMSVVGGAGP